MQHHKYVEDGVVCPPFCERTVHHISHGNIDHNPTATTATTSFHGTSISVFQPQPKKTKVKSVDS
ncbi:uncharacterized protein LOC103506659 [Caligus rogercresseyi]|uniref:Uncharacterized protein LOC103506659 n=1 Tax=Caligus rogercresseyi TaxID=217165 RepID=A0A7T8JTM9_CALRO|nr:uncharacterized protein LOC103506659 [Caligus rogercresseyi]